LLLLEGDSTLTLASGEALFPGMQMS